MPAPQRVRSQKTPRSPRPLCLKVSSSGLPSYGKIQVLIYGEYAANRRNRLVGSERHMNIAGNSMEMTLEKSRRASPPWIWPRAAYIHVPFCAHHCGYCDFAVVAGKDFLMDQYL